MRLSWYLSGLMRHKCRQSTLNAKTSSVVDITTRPSTPSLLPPKGTPAGTQHWQAPLPPQSRQAVPSSGKTITPKVCHSADTRQPSNLAPTESPINHRVPLPMIPEQYSVFNVHLLIITHNLTVSQGGIDNTLKYEQNCFVAFEEKDQVLRVLQDTLETLIHNPLNHHYKDAEGNPRRGFN